MTKESNVTQIYISSREIYSETLENMNLKNLNMIIIIHENL